MFAYKFEEVHSSMKNGKGKTRINRLNVNNKKGYKEIIVKNLKGHTLRKTRKALKKKDIHKIENRVWIPRLFA